MVVDTAWLARAGERARRTASSRGQGERPRGAHDRAAGQRAVERPAPLHQVLVLERVLRRADSRAGSSAVGAPRRGSRRRGAGGRAASRSWSAVIFLIWWVALRPSTSGPSVQPLIVLARMTVGAPPLLGGGLVGGVELAVVVAAAGQVAELVVAQVLDHLAQPRVGAEEVLADVGARLDRVALELAVDGGVHLVEQHAVVVLGQQLVPLRAPDHLDDVPAGAAEDGLELLDDLAVAAHRAVEALEVAVDDPDQVVELLAGGQRDRAEGLGLVALAVAEEAPHPDAAGVVDAAVVQVAVEAGLVDRVDRAEAHRHRRELPEVGHEPRVRVARQAAAADLRRKWSRSSSSRRPSRNARA